MKAPLLAPPYLLSSPQVLRTVPTKRRTASILNSRRRLHSIRRSNSNMRHWLLMPQTGPTMSAPPLLGRNTPAVHGYWCRSCRPPGYRQSFVGAHQRRFRIVGIRMYMRAYGLEGEFIGGECRTHRPNCKESCQYLSQTSLLG